MRTPSQTRAFRATLVGLLVAAGLLVACATAAALPTMNLAGQIGKEVNLTETEAHTGRLLEDICIVESGDVCQKGQTFGTETAAGGWFRSMAGVAVNDETGNSYVVDQADQRVQEFTATGKFVLTFGREVNETAHSEGRTDEEDVCPAPGHPADQCKTGLLGSEAGEMYYPAGIAVDNTCYERKLSASECAIADPSNGDVYVTDTFNHRVDKYSPSGGFLLMFGGKVNKDGSNVCTMAEATECRAGEEGTADGYFDKLTPGSNPIAIGGPQARVYVGDVARVQEFSPSGTWQQSVSLTALSATKPIVQVAVTPSGDIYVHALLVPGVHEYSPSASTELADIEPGSEVYSMASRANGWLAVIDKTGGLVYLPSGVAGPEFTLGFPEVSYGAAYNDGTGQLYVADKVHLDVEWFSPFVVPTPTTGPLAGSPQPTAATLTGEVNPEGVAGKTTSFFEYGPCTASSCEASPYTATVATVPAEDGEGESPVPVKAELTGLEPNELYHYVLYAEDANGTSRGTEEMFTTAIMPPTLESQPASFVGSDQALLVGGLNPENNNAVYRFEYGLCEGGEPGCASSPYPSSTSALESSAYGMVPALQTVAELAPASVYHYRLIATYEDEGATETAEGEEEVFTTQGLPEPAVSTGAVTALTGTSATLQGIVGETEAAAVYEFQLGQGSGTGVIYTTVGSGGIDPGTGTVGVSTDVAGLQPGATYSYRLVARTQQSTTVQGAVRTFTTPTFSAPFSLPPTQPLLGLPHFPEVKPPAGKPHLSIRKHHAHGAKAAIVVHVPSAGKLVANGSGISRAVKRIRNKNGGNVTVTVKLTRALRRRIAHSKHRRGVTVTVHLRFVPRHGKALAGHLRVRLR